jgi:general secretion pathway protein I
MIALAILAASLLAVSELVGAALRNHTRAAHLEVATLLARGKLAALEDEFERTGFRDFDQTDEGTFEAEGHPEVRWKVEVVKPRVELGPDRILAMLTGAGGEGGMDLSQLLGLQAQGGEAEEGSPQTIFPGAAAVAGTLQAQLAAIGEQIKKGVREVRLTVSWPEGAREESFGVVTHMVVLAPKETP